MTEPLRVGVIGLGALWRSRYRPALRALRDRFHIAAVCDPLRERAERAAKRLGCAAAAGPTDLCARGDLDALLLIDAAWYGLWPVQVACRFGKPVFCCPAPAPDTDEETVRQVEASGVRVMPVLSLRASPAAARLGELLDAALGPPRLILCRTGATGPGLLDLLDWCGPLFGGEPARVTRAEAGPLTTQLLDYGAGRAVQVTECRAGRPSAPARLEVFAERGRAVLRPPDRISWHDQTGRHSQRLAQRVPPERALLEKFHEAVTADRPVSPTLADAWQILRRLRPGA